MNGLDKVISPEYSGDIKELLLTENGDVSGQFE